MKNIRFYIIIFSIFAIFFVGGEYFFYKSIFEIIFLDVGQGDSAVIKTAEGKNIIIDGGPDNTLVYKLGQYIRWPDKNIDLFILSHPDADHLIGIIELLDRYSFKEIYITGINHKTPEYKFFLRKIQEQGIKVSFAHIKDEFIFGDLRIEKIYPKENFYGREMSNANDSSLVLKVRYKNLSVLFTGDLEKEKQEELLKYNIKSDLLKFPHHGSLDSFSEEFLSTVQPDEVIISVGENFFGHPSKKVLRYLERNSVRYVTTQENGDVIFSFTDNKIIRKH